MGNVLLQIAVPFAGFVAFAVLSLRYGAESRPVFDGRPVRDDERPNLPLSR